MVGDEEHVYQLVWNTCVVVTYNARREARDAAWWRHAPRCSNSSTPHVPAWSLQGIAPLGWVRVQVNVSMMTGRRADGLAVTIRTTLRIEVVLILPARAGRDAACRTEAETVLCVY